MTPPTVYTETTLAEFMLSELGATAAAVGLTLAGLAEAVNEAMLVYPCVVMADATNIQKIRAIARVEAWRAVCNQVAGDYDFADAGASYSRSQALQNAQKRLDQALADAAQYYPGYQVGTAKISFTNDPYKTPDITLIGGI